MLRDARAGVARRSAGTRNVMQMVGSRSGKIRWALLAAAFFCLLGASGTTPRGTCAPAKAFVGTICTPNDGARHAAILLLGGSEGGDSMARAAELFKAHGYVAASVAYFRARGLPPTLENVPVETVGRAIDALSARGDVDPHRLAVFGFSKGGELALLAASVYPSIHAVVADVPSPFAWQGISSNETAPTSSWSIAGKSLPFVPFAERIGTVLTPAVRNDEPIELRHLYDESMKDRTAVDRAFFHLERIRGPILLLAGDDDRLWDSPAQCRLALSYLRAHHHPYKDTFLHYPSAGDLFLFATPQQALIEASLGDDLEIAFGGTAKGNVKAARSAWPTIYAFLTSALRGYQ